MTETNLAYAAGLIDGEGSIHIEVTKGKWYAPRMCLGMTLPAKIVMETYHRQYGGTIRVMRAATEKWEEAWMWYVHGPDAVRFLTDILPYLRIKKRHAELAIRVGQIRDNLPKRKNGQAKWTEEAREECARIKMAVAALNKKGPRAQIVEEPYAGSSPIATWNPTLDVWEAMQMNLFSGRSDVFSETWPASGMTRNGVAFELPTWELPTDDTEYSWLPTPTATYSGNTAENHLRKKPGRSSVTDLRILIEEVGL